MMVDHAKRDSVERRAILIWAEERCNNSINGCKVKGQQLFVGSPLPCACKVK